MLLQGKRLHLRRGQVLKKLGALLKFRSHLNLHGGLLEVPDLFWNDAELEANFNDLSNLLDIKKRVAILNKKLDYANEIAVLLRDYLSEKHSFSLEWCIISLISLEIVFQFIHFVKETKGHAQ